MKYYTMFFVDEEQFAQSQNGVQGAPSDQIRTFVLCCKQLSASLARFDPRHELLVLTNNESAVRQVAPALATRVIPFATSVPRGVKAHSHYHKLDVFRWLAEQGDDYSILLDADTTCINPMPENLRLCIESGIPVFYDISDQIYPAYGRERVLRDKNRLMSMESTGLWIGGEFLGGPKPFFAELYERCSAVSGRYYAIAETLHHQGDETLTSVAVEEMLRGGHSMCEIGKLGIVGRYWSSATLHVQRPFAAYKDNFILHLPMDKEFLARGNRPELFVRRYERYLAQGRNILRRGSRRLMRMLHAPAAHFPSAHGDSLLHSAKV